MKEQNNKNTNGSGNLNSTSNFSLADKSNGDDSESKFWKKQKPHRIYLTIPNN